MKRKIILFSALGTLITGMTVCAASGAAYLKKQTDAFSLSRAITPPTDVEQYDAWLNSWSQDNHLYVHYNRGEKNDYSDFCFWMWNDEDDTNGTLWAYGGPTTYEGKSVEYHPMTRHWMHNSDITPGESNEVFKDRYGVIADVNLGDPDLHEGKTKKGVAPKPATYEGCEDIGFLFPKTASMDGSAHWTSDGGKDNDIWDWREPQNWRDLGGGKKAIHIFLSSGQLDTWSYYAGSGIPQVKVNPIDSATDNRYDSVTTNLPDKYPGQIAPTSTSFKKLGVGYQIFVASFRDSNGDGYGDLRGVIDSLDYLKDLGVEVLWLTPIQQSGSYHGYDIIDYYAVDKRFGTLEDYRELLYKAHQKGMKVLMDLVLNHTSKNNTWFIKSEWGVNNEGSEFEKDNTGIKWRDVYTWKYGTDEIWTAATNADGSIKVPGSTGPCDYVRQTVAANALNANGASWFKSGESNYYYYGKFGSDMPELNYENQATRDLVQDMARYWMSFGLDGFRLDAVKHIYMKDEVDNTGSDVILPDIGMKRAYDEQNETYINKPYDYSQDLTKNIAFWKEFAINLKKVYPDCFLVGENFDGYGTRMAGYIQALDSQFDFASYYHSQDAYTYSSSGSYTSKRELETYGPARSSSDAAITVPVSGTNYNYTVPGGKRNDFINGAYTSNHDVYRAINMINNKVHGLAENPADRDYVSGTPEEIGRAKIAGAMAILNPGVSWIYYGDELGMSSNTNTHLNPDVYGNENCEDTWFRQPFIWQGAKGDQVRPSYVNGKYQFKSSAYDSYNSQLLSTGKGVTVNADGSFTCTNEIYQFYKGLTALKKLYPENARATFENGDQVYKMTITGNGKSLMILINMGFNSSTYGVDTSGYNSTPVAQIGCSGVGHGSNFGANNPYSVVAFQAN